MQFTVMKALNGFKCLMHEKNSFMYTIFTAIAQAPLKIAQGN